MNLLKNTLLKFSVLLLLLLATDLNATSPTNQDNTVRDETSLNEPQLSAENAETERDKEVERVRKLVREGFKRKPRSTSHKLKVWLFIREDIIIKRLHKAGITFENLSLTHILSVLTDEDEQKKDFIFHWNGRSKIAIELLEHWRQHPEEINEKPPVFVYTETARKISDRQLFNTLTEYETILTQDLQTQATGTNQLFFFLYHPSEHPDVQKDKSTGVRP
ncbi:MAG: hypothetical protein GX811_10680 [Lentisphaerae bacterium]|nr:hypothetical protein [Lentisphaerota bacterium]